MAGGLVFIDNCNDFSRWPTVAGTPTTVAARNGNGINLPDLAAISTTFPASDTVTFGFAWHSPVSALSTGAVIAKFHANDSSNAQVALTVGTGATSLRISREVGNQLGESATGVLAVNTWYYIEVQVKLHDTTGSAEVRLNGTTVINASGVDTNFDSTSKLFNKIVLGPSTLVTMYDDMYLKVGAGQTFFNDLGNATWFFRDTCETMTAWGSSQGTPAVAAGRNGNGFSLPSGTRMNYSPPSALSSMTIGFAYKSPASITTNQVICKFNSSDASQAAQCSLDIQTGGALRFYRETAGTLATTATGLIVANTWYYIEVQVLLHDTAGIVNVRLNGTLVINLTGVDTNNTSTALAIGKVTFWNLTQTYMIDDFYYKSGSGQAFMGDLGDMGLTGVGLVSMTLTPTGSHPPVGGTVQLVATGLNSDSSTADVTSACTWSSNNISVATVSSTGLVTGVAAGTATITGTHSSGPVATVLVTIDPVVTSIALTPTGAHVDTGATQQMTATGTWSDTHTSNETANCAWSSGSTGIATINSSTGLLTGVAAGTVTITAVHTVAPFASSTVTVIVDPPPTGVVPLNVQPYNGAQVLSDYPVLSADIPVQPGSTETWFVTWQVSLSNTFASGVTTETSAVAVGQGQTTAHTMTHRLSTNPAWYVRARSVNAVGGAFSTWSAVQTFSILHLAIPSGMSPTGGQLVTFGTGAVTFSWTFSDPNPGDIQTGYQILVNRSSDDHLMWDSGKVPSSAASAFFTFAPGDIDRTYYWTLRLWDESDSAGNWSYAQQFILGGQPVITIISVDASIPTPAVIWQVTSGTQYSFRVVYGLDDDVIFDSGVVIGTSTIYRPPKPVVWLGPTFWVQVYGQDAKGFEGVSSQYSFTPAWVAPGAGTGVVIDSSTIDTIGGVTINWTVAAIDGSFQEWRFYRRLPGESLWTLVGTSANQLSGTWVDYSAGLNTDYEYAVVQMGTLESIYEAVPTHTPGNYYWLVVPDQPSLNFEIPQVSEDNFTDVYMQSEMMVIGRGRRVDIGTRVGYEGSLTAQFRGLGTMTPRQERLQVEAIRASRLLVLLKNPFGDVMEAALGDVQIARIAGVGMAEYTDVTISYLQVT